MDSVNFYPLHIDSRFEISEYGIIRNRKTKSVKSQYLNDAGYPMITISKGNKSNPYRVHKLLAEMFIPNPDKKPEVNHIDGNKKNYALSNLEWSTHAENMGHAFTTGLANNTGERNGMNKISEATARQIKELLATGMSQYKIANQIGSISRSTVLKIKLGLMWAHV